MANYKESAVTGTSWVRSYRVVIENPLNGVPNIMFHEEEAVAVGTDVIRRHIGQVTQNFDTPSATFAIVDPTTGLPTGSTATHGDIYVLLSSLYLDLATKRDIL